jgi:SAM-dependent methyltransferase
MSVARRADAAARDQRQFWETGGIYRRSDHPVVALFARQRVAYLERTGVLDGVRTLLDVGAGNGFSSAHYPPSISVVACDFADGMLAANPVRDRVRSLAYQLPFGDRTFDVATCWELLHHAGDPVTVVREMLRVSRCIIVFEPNRIHPGHLWLGVTRLEERACLRFTPGYVRRLIRQAGGRIRMHRRCGMLFPNITPLAVARLLVRLPFRAPVIGISQLVVAEH